MNISGDDNATQIYWEKPYEEYSIRDNSIDACPSSGPKRIGVTIATADYMPMACEAARRWKKYSGLECIILTSEPRECWWAKFNLASLFSGLQVCFFDADVYFVNKLPIDNLWSKGIDISATHDPGVYDALAFPALDCITYKLNPAHYFNGGFWACDFSNPKIIQWLNIARDITRRVQEGSLPIWRDFGEQTALNVAAKLTKLSLRILPDEWAFFHWAWRNRNVKHPNNILGIHAAGYPGIEAKMEALSYLVAAYEKPEHLITLQEY